LSVRKSLKNNKRALVKNIILNNLALKNVKGHGLYIDFSASYAHISIFSSIHLGEGK